MNTKEIGYRDGAQAYRDGKPRLVVREASLDYFIETHTRAECTAYMQGWYNGWDMANVRDDSAWKREVGLKS